MPDSPAPPLSFRDKLIKQHVNGLDFVDVGALWQTRNEKVSVATLAGAKSAAIIDVMPAGHESWLRCRERCAEFGVSGYAEHSHDLNDPLIHEKIGRFDFVYCSGIIYHVPAIFYTLERLHFLSKRYLMIGSMIVPERIENDHGSIRLDGGGVLYVPGLDERTRAILRAHFQRLDLKVPHVTPDTAPQPFMWKPGHPNYGPWWWLFPLSTLASMVETVGFRVLDSESGWGGRSGTIFCEKR